MDYFFTYTFTSTRIPQKSSNYFIFPSESNWFEVLCSVVIRYLQICRLILQIIFWAQRNKCSWHSGGYQLFFTYTKASDRFQNFSLTCKVCYQQYLPSKQTWPVTSYLNLHISLFSIHNTLDCSNWDLNDCKRHWSKRIYVFIEKTRLKLYSPISISLQGKGVIDFQDRSRASSSTCNLNSTDRMKTDIVIAITNIGERKTEAG